MKINSFSSICATVTLLCSVALATISPDSLTGEFKVGACSRAFDSAEITNQNEGLLVSFFKENQSTAVFVSLTNQSSAAVDLEVVADGFTISNLFKDKDLNILKTIKIGRSASGGRVRVVELDAQGAKSFECVLYRK